MVTDLNDKVRLAAEFINAADALLITAGAGIGVDSGLPDFRGNHGFWRAYPVIAGLGLSFAEIANPAWFRKDPFLAWAFYGHRLNLYRSTSPHAGFHRLLEVAKSKRQGYFVFTSNVDGQFQKAGFAPDCIVECHGSIHHFQCSAVCTEKIWDAEAEVVNVDTEFSCRGAIAEVQALRGAGAAQYSDVWRLGVVESPHRTAARQIFCVA